MGVPREISNAPSHINFSFQTGGGQGVDGQGVDTLEGDAEVPIPATPQV